MASCARALAMSGPSRQRTYLTIMNVNRNDQRVLHALAQGGLIRLERDPSTGAVTEALCLNRDGWALSPFSIDTFKRLKRRRLIASTGGGPYRITRHGLAAVRSQPDNR